MCEIDGRRFESKYIHAASWMRRVWLHCLHGKWICPTVSHWGAQGYTSGRGMVWPQDRTGEVFSSVLVAQQLMAASCNMQWNSHHQEHVFSFQQASTAELQFAFSTVTHHMHAPTPSAHHQQEGRPCPQLLSQPKSPVTHHSASQHIFFITAPRLLWGGQEKDSPHFQRSPRT